ncbi:hypothetical protein KKF84_22190 [Myxococcota bacterium]|nr:hypothetical protein [Myxococcota bacterium]MBU1538038.1 hypothetical protein [Myxococcota bacterium]
MKPILLLLPLLIACKEPPKSTPRVQDLTRMVPREAGWQLMEGRVSFSENLVVLGRGVTLLKSFEAGISGVRQHGTSDDHTTIVDTFQKAAIEKPFKMNRIGSYLKGLRLSVDTFNPAGVVNVVSASGEDPHIMNRLFIPLWRFLHTLPPASGPQRPKIVTGFSWTTRETVTRRVQGRAIPVYRKNTYTIKSISHTGQLHFAVITGQSFSSSQKAITMGPFTVEIIGRGTMEAEFSLDRGVFTHIKGREILGWAGTYQKTPTEKPVTTGYRQELTVDIHLTENP